MKKNKIAKKVLAMVGAAAVVLSLGGAKVAEAATCSHPVSSRVDSPGFAGSYQWSDTHIVTVKDEDTGLTDKFTCTRWYQMVEMVTYCGICDAKIGSDVCRWTTHSLRFCPSY